MKSAFITFEGIEGTGKTTQIRRVADWLRSKDIAFIQTREPGGCFIADQIRAVLLDSKNTALSPEAELLLYLASRAQHVTEVVRPALDANKIVLCDRFADATQAYQGYARGLGSDLVSDINRYATGGLTPDLTLLLDIPVETGLARARRRADAIEDDSDKEDRFEKEHLDFHQRVREGYLAIARSHADRVLILDAAGSEDEVFHRVQRALGEFLGIPL
jgi:dTMP kinase